MQEEVNLVRRGAGGSLKEIAPGVAYMTVVFANVYAVGEPDGGRWVLVDSGLPKFSGHLRRALAERYGEGARPEAIVLTHGHFDHAGSALELAERWDVPVYAHRLELPYLTGKSDYPPQDPTVGGTLAQMSRLFPHSGYDFGSRVQPLPANGHLPDMPEWRVHHTPGHTAGHAALFRERDRVLLAGDALATVDQDSPFGMVVQKPEFRRPPAPFTTDWGAARESIALLASLRPETVGAGHGLPMTGAGVAAKLEEFSARFTPPRRGRYVARPARADETGVIELPPPVPDPLPKIVAGVALAAIGGAAFVALTRRRR
ncbi:MAG: MBL fold metallo-hydrolase [Pyrinomonadaceae bacterium]